MSVQGISSSQRITQKRLLSKAEGRERRRFSDGEDDLLCLTMDGSPGKRSLPSRSNRGVGPQRLSSQEEWNRLMVSLWREN